MFSALGLRNGELLVGATDVLLQDRAWPEAGASVEEWIEAFAEVGNDLEAPALRIQPVIGEVLAALQRNRRRLAGADVGLRRDLFCDLRERRRCQRAAEKIRHDHPGMVGACGHAELTCS